MYNREFASLYAGLSHTKNKNYDQKEAFGFDEGFANGRFTEEQFDKYLSDFDLECLPNNEVSSCK